MFKQLLYSTILAGIFLVGIIGVSAGSAAKVNAADLTLPLIYTFNTAGTVNEASSASASWSPYWWLQSGGQLIIQNGVGSTLAGAIPSSNPWKAVYASRAALTTDNGAHPQNVFKLFMRDSVQSPSVQVYIKRLSNNLQNSVNRHPYNGESLFARYQDADNYYYAGIRADGYAVIKKKTGGVYQTLATKQILSGTYDAATSPDLIPLNKWIGLKFVVSDIASDSSLALYTDVGRTGTWQQVLTTTDRAPILGSGLVGIQSDFADAQFEDFILNNSSVSVDAQSTSTLPTPPPATSVSYDAVVMADNPVMYLPMSTASTGSETDKSGNGHNGSYKGGTPAVATLPNGDKAADFNGGGQYLTVPSSSDLSIATTHTLTWEAWVRPDTFQFKNASGDGYVDWMGKCESYSPTCEWEARLYGSDTTQNRPRRFSAYAFNLGAGLGSGADWQPASGVLQAGQWVHVVAEYQTTSTPSQCSSSYPGTINIWINGIKQNFAAHAPTGCMSQYKVTPKSASSPLNIGTMALDTWFKGAVGKVAIYNYLLTQTQIEEHFKAMAGQPPSGSCGDTCTTAPVN
jgi:hypothetical protein